MEEERKQFYLKLLRSEISPALGCTEPAAAALCAAGAAEMLGEKVERAEIHVSEYILKNGMNVGIPGLDCTGLYMAGALGAVSAEPQKKLLVLSSLSEEQKQQAAELVRKERVSVTLKENVEKIYIAVKVYGQNHCAEAVIEGQHTRFIQKLKDGEVIWENTGNTGLPESTKKDADSLSPSDITMEEIWEFIQDTDSVSLAFLQEVIDVNMAIAEEGLRKDYGLHVGRGIIRNEKGSLIGRDIANTASFTTAAAVDARMAGCTKAVMSVAGSGNQGLTATIPFIVTANAIGSSTDKLYRSLALSILITIHAKQYIGRLSVLCGCSIASAIGVGGAMVFLYGGTLKNVYASVRTMTADISGMICDGAKPGCALKIATSVNAAARAAQLALNGIGATQQDGIVRGNVEETLENLGKLGNEGMSGTNGIILNMLLNKAAADLCS